MAAALNSEYSILVKAADIYKSMHLRHHISGGDDVVVCGGCQKRSGRTDLAFTSVAGFWRGQKKRAAAVVASNAGQYK